MSSIAVASSTIKGDTAEVERVFGKIAWRILPLLMLGYIFNSLDRVNVGFGALKMNQAIGLSVTQFGYGASLLFIGYLVFEIPSNVVLYRIGARFWLARIMITWGLISAGTAFVVSPTSFYILRFSLGVAEAGFFPGVAFCLAQWFPPNYRARIFAWFMLSVPLSGLIGGPLSGLLLGMDGYAGLAGWQWMFIIEGLPSAILGILALWTLADGPEKASWLTSDERRLASERIKTEIREREVSHLWESMKDIRVLTLAGVEVGWLIGTYGVSIWLPLIIKTQNFSDLNIGILTAIPAGVSCIVMLIWARAVDRSGRKIDNLAAMLLLGGLGLVLAGLTTHVFVVSFIGLAVSIVATNTVRTVFWTIPSRFLSGIGMASGFAFINSVGTLGSFIGTFIVGWLKGMTNSYSLGMIVMAFFLFLATLLSLGLKLFIRRE